jgi:hypothetical protein
MKKQRERQRRGRKARRLWTGEATALDLLHAGNDPRQTHFAFYVEPDRPINSLDPGKRPPSSTSNDCTATNSSKRVREDA